MQRSWRPLACVAFLAGLAACSKTTENASPASSGAASGAQEAATAAVPGGSARPGATIDKAPTIEAGGATDGEIRTTGQSDFYRYLVSAKRRDTALVRLQNRSITLRPYLKFYDSNRSLMFEKYDGTPGASIERALPLEPGATFYVQVVPYNSTGKYTLSVQPQQAFDAHEPNDDALSATPGRIGVANEGSILDDHDPDWFRIAGATTKTVHVVLDNQSATLRPYVKVFSYTKSQVLEKYDGTPGANLDFTVEVEPGRDFYLEVQPYNSAGKYRLTATSEAK